MANKAINTKTLYKKLDKLFEEATTLSLNERKKWVIFSDLHMGDGGTTDDFRRNSDLFVSALKKYLQSDHSLILNGDVEELQRFAVSKIIKKWKDVYRLFDDFHREGRLFKTIGNHDLELLLMKNLPFEYNHYEAIKLRHNERNDLLVFHGHQASKKYQEHNELIGFTLKYFANPLGIKSYSVSHSSKKQYKIEKQVYGYSAFNKVVSIIGHTHRPLFESLHKVERLKFKIEQLCRIYVESGVDDVSEIKDRIKSHKKELKKYYRENRDYSYQN
ncbi:MAG: metallophosphoesterase, partial [Bacteroidota bacterium]